MIGTHISLMPLRRRWARQPCSAWGGTCAKKCRDFLNMCYLTIIRGYVPGTCFALFDSRHPLGEGEVLVPCRGIGRSSSSISDSTRGTYGIN
jgi:hypothetical protein